MLTRAAADGRTPRRRAVPQGPPCPGRPSRRALPCSGAGGHQRVPFLNDLVQSLIPAIYPLLKTAFHLTFGQVGLITLTVQLTPPCCSPWSGLAADRRPMPYSLTVGMGCTLVGLLLLARAPTYTALLVAAALVGMGSSVFHPESSRVARRASGGQFGLAQSLFQVGGNAGAGSGAGAGCLHHPPAGARPAWPGFPWLRFSRCSSWRKSERGPGERGQLAARRLPQDPERPAISPRGSLAPSRVAGAHLLEYVYLASLTSYYTFT